MDDNIGKERSKSLVIRTGKTTNHMALRFFPETILSLKVNCFEGILYRIKSNRMVNDHSSSCNS